MDIHIETKPRNEDASASASAVTAAAATEAVRPEVEAAGCALEWKEDKSLVITSVACFVSFVVYGAALSSLGAAIPILAVDYAVDESALSGAFAVRGVGYLFGTISSAVLLEGFYGISWQPSAW